MITIFDDMTLRGQDLTRTFADLETTRVFQLQSESENVTSDGGDLQTHACGCSCCNDSDSNGTSTFGLASPFGSAPVFGPDPSEDTVGNTAATASTIALGSLVTGETQSGGDQDWYAIDLVAGTSYTFFLVGVTNDAAITDAYLRLIGTDGTTELATADDINSTEGDKLSLDSRLIYTPTESGTFYLSAQGFDNSAQPGGTFGLGNYMLTAAPSDEAIVGTVDQLAFFLTNQFWGGERSWANGEIKFYYGNLAADVRALFDTAFEAWSDVANITFTSVATAAEAQMTFTTNEEGAYSSSSTTNGVITSNVINISQTDWIDRFGTDPYGQLYQTIVHEIGHSIGLGHQGFYNGAATYNIDNLYSNDAENWSVMSYFGPGTAGTGTTLLSWTPLVADVAAVQSLYGINTTTRTENDTYISNSNLAGAYNFEGATFIPAVTIYDAGGIDTIDASVYSMSQTINLNIDGFSSIGGAQNNVSIGRATIIENAVGGNGADTIFGNSASNVLTGRQGNDVMDGGDGIDYAAYQSGTFEGLTITENADGSTTVQSGSWGTDTLTNIEFIRINGQDYAIGPEDPGPDWTANADTGDGTAGDDTIDGLAGNDTINGLAGNDTLYGSEGNDTLNGGDGNDILVGGLGQDVLNGGAGIDTADYTNAAAGIRVFLATGVGNLGEANGDTLNDIENVEGSAFADFFYGAAGTNSFNGNAGDDYFFEIDADDSLNGGDGYDRVFAAANSGALNIDLAASELESVRGANQADILDGSGSTVSLILYGNGRADILSGGSAADYINGGAGDDIVNGGAGNDILDGLTNADTINGGEGNDIIYVDHLDTLDGGAGYDRIYVRGYSDGVNFDLGAANIEFAAGNFRDDIFDGSSSTVSVKLLGGSGNDTLTGGAGDDQIFGQTGDDIVSGGAGNDLVRAGAGADSLSGGDGDDIIFVDGEDVFVDGGAGNDRVYANGGSSAITLDLNAANVEYVSGSENGDNFTAAGMAVAVKMLGRGGNDTLIGGEVNDLIFGGAGDDSLNGSGGDDYLFGQAGTDSFVFTANWGYDRIVDFDTNGETLDFSALGITLADLTITAQGNHTLIEYGADSIFLFSVNAATLDASDFSF